MPTRFENGGFLAIAFAVAACDTPAPSRPAQAPVTTVTLPAPAPVPPPVQDNAPPALAGAGAAQAAPPTPKPGAGAVGAAGAVVRSLGSAFRRCYNTGLRDEDPDMKGVIRMTARIDAQGAVSSVEPSSKGLSPKVVECLRQVVLAAKFAPPEGGGATIVIPVTFVSQPAATADGGVPAGGGW